MHSHKSSSVIRFHENSSPFNLLPLTSASLKKLDKNYQKAKLLLPSTRIPINTQFCMIRYHFFRINALVSILIRKRKNKHETIRKKNWLLLTDFIVFCVCSINFYFWYQFDHLFAFVSHFQYFFQDFLRSCVWQRNIHFSLLFSLHFRCNASD